MSWMNTKTSLLGNFYLDMFRGMFVSSSAYLCWQHVQYRYRLCFSVICGVCRPKNKEIRYSKTSLVLNDVMGSEEKSTEMNQTCDYMMTAAPNLLALPDDVLLIIMSHLQPLDVLNVARLSERLELLSQDRTLWTVVDTRSRRLSLSELTTIVEQLQTTTHTLAARGIITDLPENVCITPELLIQIANQCPALDTLILEDQYAEIKQTKKQAIPKQMHLKLFPKTLTKLSLKGCDFQIKKYQISFFHDINVHLPLLKVLILSDCSWVYPHDFIPIGKCNALEELRLDGCHRLGECVAYTSLAARFGFPALKILDLRDTSMGDSDVSCFNRTSTLTHLYLECPTNPKHRLNSLSGTFDARYGWTEYVFPEGSPIIVINRLGRNFEQFPSQRYDATPTAQPARPNEAGPSSIASEGPPRRYKFRKVYDGRTMWPLTRSVSSLCMSSPGPSSSPEKSQKRKSDCVSSGSKRVKREDLNSHSEEEPDESFNVSTGRNNQNDIKIEIDISSDSSSSDDEDETIVYMLRGKKYVRKIPKSHRCLLQREVDLDGIPGPEPIISDLCIMSFADVNSGRMDQDCAAANVERGVWTGSNFWYVRLTYPEVVGARPNLHTLVLRNFSHITDQSLRLLTGHSSLRYLDVSGTSVTEGAVLDFKLRRPEVEVISDFDVPF